MEGAPKNNNEQPRTDRELLEDLYLVLTNVNMNPGARELIEAAITNKKPGRLIFTLDKNINYVDVDTSKSSSALTDEILDLIDTMREMMLTEEERELFHPESDPDQLIVSFEEAKIQ